VSLAVADSDPVRRPSGLGGLVVSLAINFLGPYLIYIAAAPHFAPHSTVPLLLSASVPVTEFFLQFLRRRIVDVIAIISGTQLAAGIVITLLAGNAHASLEGHALMPALLGMVYFVSILIGKPLVQPLARQTMAGGDPERQARFDAITAHPAAHRAFVNLSWAWTMTLMLESAVLLAATQLLSVSIYLIISNVLNYGVIGLLVWGGITYGRRAAARARG
jgi:hypothetical protein